MSFINQDYLVQGIEKLGLLVKGEQLLLMETFYQELTEWNKHTNLTRIIDEKDFIDKHLFDSLSCIYALEKEQLNQKIKVIDIGTGAGFPLLPLWFFFPHWQITLVDSVNKKLKFISHFLEKLKTLGFSDKNIKVVHSRAEDLASKKSYREQYDLTVSRAVSNLASLTELCTPFIKKGGLFLSMKGFEVEAELAEAEKVIKMAGTKLLTIKKYDLLDTGLKRSLLLIAKIEKTPEWLPRKTGLAQKEPIK